MRSLLTAVVAGLLGFAAARIGGSSFNPKQSAPTEEAPPARETAAVAAPAPVFSAPDPAKPIAERLDEARRSKDSLEAAARSPAVIDSMTLEDFQKLGADPGRMPVPHIGGPENSSWQEMRATVTLYYRDEAMVAEALKEAEVIKKEKDARLAAEAAVREKAAREAREEQQAEAARKRAEERVRLKEKATKLDTSGL